MTRASMQDLLVATSVTLAWQGGSCRQRAHAYWSATAKPLSFSVSAVLLLPLRPRVPQTDVR